MEFSIFDTNQIMPSQSLIVLGMKLNYFTLDTAKDYILWKIENDIDLQDTDYDVLNCKDIYGAISLMSKNQILITNEIKRILRFLVLSELSLDDELIFQKIESIYSDFDYPEDMNNFIYYMPYHLIDESEKELEPKVVMLKRFNKFMLNEREYIYSLENYCFK